MLTFPKNVEIPEYDKAQIRARVEREELAAAETRARDAYERAYRAKLRRNYGMVCSCLHLAEEDCSVHGK